MAQRLFNVEGVRLACEDVGSGPPIVLLHGFPLDHTMWNAQIAALQSHFRVIAPDLRGFGDSHLADGDAENGVGMERYAADVIALLDWLQISEPVVLAGLSMGGYIGWQAVLRWPERIRGLIPCDTRAAADADEPRAARFKMAEAAMQAGNSSPALVMIPRLLGAETRELRPEVEVALRAMIERQSAETVAAAQRGMARREDVRGKLDAITADSLCIVGVEDVISPPAELHEFAQLLAKSGEDDVRIVEIEHAGHMTPMENPAAVTAAIAAFARQCYNL
ncbi:alpha/beta fold hydrolase [Lacipirellula parvula]|uniref:Hydrolase n=1 Tax=Lacipirellula parvula TaxID=2650471 RepID=A0A5K7XIR9_9BACT|nr:alpha/beta hydrolase [Lacipirellula parvula]BBO36002.1 hydrolase [Lacipirellula parvula]